MEKIERTKYYPISLKNKELHNKFVIEQKIKGFRNADGMIEFLLKLENENKFLEERCTQKETDFNELLNTLVEKNEKIEELEEEIKKFQNTLSKWIGIERKEIE